MLPISSYIPALYCHTIIHHIICKFVYHYISLYIIMYHYISLYIIIYRYISLYMIIYHYISLYIIIYHYVSLYIIIYHYISLYIIIYDYISLYIIIYHYISLYIIIYPSPHVCLIKVIFIVSPQNGYVVPLGKPGKKHHDVVDHSSMADRRLTPQRFLVAHLEW